MLQWNALPSAFKKTKIIALLKPGKPDHLPESYRPSALLSVVFKLFERLLYSRIASEIEKLIPAEQAGFRKNRSCEEQVLSLTNHIEDGFQRQLKTGVVFIDLTAAYDTVWKKGLLFKLIKAVPCTRLKKLNNGVPQAS